MDLSHASVKVESTKIFSIFYSNIVLKSLQPSPRKKNFLGFFSMWSERVWNLRNNGPSAINNKMNMWKSMQVSCWWGREFFSILPLIHKRSIAWYLDIRWIFDADISIYGIYIYHTIKCINNEIYVENKYLLDKINASFTMRLQTY